MHQEVFQQNVNHSNECATHSFIMQETPHDLRLLGCENTDRSAP